METIRKGSKGDSVVSLQNCLLKLGFDLGTAGADGDFGGRTDAAVRKFQSDSGLEVDGVVGSGTWGALSSQCPDISSGGGQQAPQGTLGMATSDQGIRFIARHEGFVPHLYNDSANHCTIGYGHLVHQGPCNGTEPAEFQSDISEDRGRGLLSGDIKNTEQAVNNKVKVSLTQNQFDALVSFTFNVGTGAFSNSTLLKNLNNGQYDTVPDEMNKWVNAGGHHEPGLVIRRGHEGALFRDGTY